MGKKEDIIDFILGEIKKTNRYIYENKLENAAEQFFNVVRWAFASIFDINFQFTYEELDYKLHHMDEALDEIDNRIKGIREKIEKEYAQKKKGNIKAIKNNIKGLSSEMGKELERKKEYIRLNNIFLGSRLREEITAFSEEISELRYDKSESSKNKLIGLIKKFEQIVNKSMEVEARVKKDGGVDLILSPFKRLTDMFKIGKVSKVHHLLNRAETEISKNKIDNAKLIYLKILKLYCSMRDKDRKEVYNIILSLFQHIQSKSKS